MMFSAIKSSVISIEMVCVYTSKNRRKHVSNVVSNRKICTLILEIMDCKEQLDEFALY